jgi:hypothetical protein
MDNRRVGTGKSASCRGVRSVGEGGVVRLGSETFRNRVTSAGFKRLRRVSIDRMGPTVTAYARTVARLRQFLGRFDPVVVAWVAVVVGVVLAAVSLDYDVLRNGARVLFYAVLVELAITIPEEATTENRNAEQAFLVVTGLTAIGGGFLFEGVIGLVFGSLSATQLLALAGLGSRVYANLSQSGSLRRAVTADDRVTRPFTTVSCGVGVVLPPVVGGVVALGGGLGPVPDADSAWFVALAVSASVTAGLLVTRRRAD